MNAPNRLANPKGRILDVADRLFYEQGYLATGINQIIAEANTAKASFYQYFPTKEYLAIAYLERRHRSILTGLETALNQHSDPQDRLADLFAFLRQFVEQTQFRGCAFLNLAAEFPERDSPVRDCTIAHKTAARNLLEAFAQDCLGEKVPATAARQLGRALFLLFEGAIAESQIWGAPWPVDDAEAAARNLLFSG